MSELFRFVSSFVIVGLICGGVYLGVTLNGPLMKGADAGTVNVLSRPTKPARPTVPNGGGKAPEQIRPATYEVPISDKEGSDSRTSEPTHSQTNSGARADILVHESLAAAKHGEFGKANDLANEARQLASDHPAATGAWYLAAYAKNYPDLADEALEKMGGDDIYLGAKYGRVAFVERDEDTYKFRWRGGKLELSLAELKKMDDVRFGLTRKYLDNANHTANHLILAAVHYLKNIDETGRYNLEEPVTCLGAAVARCEIAVGKGDEVSEHARQMLALFAWLESQTTVYELDNAP